VTLAFGDLKVSERRSAPHSEALLINSHCGFREEIQLEWKRNRAGRNRARAGQD
jgi:hypothetical protein